MDGDKTTVEVEKNKVKELEKIWDEVKEKLESFGLRNVTINPDGYKMGNMK